MPSSVCRKVKGIPATVAGFRKHVVHIHYDYYKALISWTINEDRIGMFNIHSKMQFT